MDVLEWVDDLEIDDTLSAHAKEFLNTANTFIHVNNAGRGEEEIDNTLNGLSEYSRKNFPAQEELMESIDYPRFDEHKAEHRKFNLEVAKLLKRRLLVKRSDVPLDEYDERGIDGILNDLADFINDWYHMHLLGSDKRFADYYNLEYKGKTPPPSS